MSKKTARQILTEHEFLDQDFICVWDDIVPENLCGWLRNWVDNVSFINTDRSDPINGQDQQCALNIYEPAASNNLMEYVNTCASIYSEKYHYLKNFPLHTASTLIQKTKPKQGYHWFHGENVSYNSRNIILAWMVYLNDVDSGGETEFLYQQLKIKPKRGRVVIWPGSFTHLHRGNPPMSDKYIATGWYASAGGFEKYVLDPMKPLDISDDQGVQ